MKTESVGNALLCRIKAFDLEFININLLMGYQTPFILIGHSTIWPRLGCNVLQEGRTIWLIKTLSPIMQQVLRFCRLYQIKSDLSSPGNGIRSETSLSIKSAFGSKEIIRKTDLSDIHKTQP